VKPKAPKTEPDGARETGERWGTWEDNEHWRREGLTRLFGSKAGIDPLVEPVQSPEHWGSWEDADRMRREQFLRRTPAQRLRWLEESLSLVYLRNSGKLKPDVD
jgi:hypothetical protein